MAIVLQNAIKPSFFVTSGRNSGEIESEFNYKLCKTNPILSAVGGLQMNVKFCKIKDYENKWQRRVRKNKPNQTQFQNTTPKEWEEKKVSGKLLKKQFYFFYVANPANPALYSENTDT